MLRFCSVMFLMVASGLLAAPAPVFRPSTTTKTPYEVMLAQLRETRKITGPESSAGETWTLSIDSIDGKKIVKPVLTFKGPHGNVKTISDARAGEIAADRKNGTFFLSLYEVTPRPDDGTISSKRLEMDLPTPKR